jgi:hypothetical protein
MLTKQQLLTLPEGESGRIWILLLMQEFAAKDEFDASSDLTGKALALFYGQFHGP